MTSPGAQDALIRRSKIITLRHIDILKYRRALRNSWGISPIFYLFICLYIPLWAG
jgi:hypothetical protein